jgi:hypothetical protein
MISSKSIFSGGNRATLTFTHLRAKAGPLLDQSTTDFEAIVRARIVFSMDNLVALKRSLNQMLPDQPPLRAPLPPALAQAPLANDRSPSLGTCLKSAAEGHDKRRGALPHLAKADWFDTSSSNEARRGHESWRARGAA